MPLALSPILTLLIDLLTELAPASSLAFERPESILMCTPPRNAKKERLTCPALLLYSYLQAGMILSGGCLITYFMIFAEYGVSAKDLSENMNQFFPSASGQAFVTSTLPPIVYTAEDQQFILDTVNSAWYLAIVCGQASHIFVCRTTTISIFTHGIFSNKWTNLSVLLAIGLACLIIYTPGITVITLGKVPNQLIILYAALATFGALWGWSELRKFVTRRHHSTGRSKSLFNRLLAW